MPEFSIIHTMQAISAILNKSEATACIDKKQPQEPYNGVKEQEN